MSATRSLLPALLLLLLGLGFAGCEGIYPETLTRANYDRVEIGMTQDQVEGILGRGHVRDGGGVALPGVEADAHIMKWEERNRTITVTFLNGEVIAKSQSGL